VKSNDLSLEKNQFYPNLLSTNRLIKNVIFTFVLVSIFIMIKFASTNNLKVTVNRELVSKIKEITTVTNEIKKFAAVSSVSLFENKDNLKNRLFLKNKLTDELKELSKKTTPNTQLQIISLSNFVKLDNDFMLTSIQKYEDIVTNYKVSPDKNAVMSISELLEWEKEKVSYVLNKDKNYIKTEKIDYLQDIYYKIASNKETVLLKSKEIEKEIYNFDIKYFSFDNLNLQEVRQINNQLINLLSEG
jgi:hypothetical protein